MSNWINHVTLALPRNGTTSHICDPSNATGGGTVVAGSAFTPTAGRLLVVVCAGAVTFTTPSGWTLPAGGSAVGNGGLYVFHKDSASGGDTFTTTQNGSNYPVVFDVYEFAAGSTFLGSDGQAGVSNGGAGPSITGLTGTNWVALAGGDDDASTNTMTATWNNGTEVVDTNVVASGTDGYWYGLSELNSYTGSSASGAVTLTHFVNSMERLVFAVTPAAGGPNSGSATGSVSITGSATGHKAPHGSATGSVSITGSATGHKAPHGSGTGIAGVKHGAATGHMDPHGSAAGSVSVTGHADAATSADHGAATGSVSISGSAHGHAVHHSQVTGSVSISGSAAGHAVHRSSVSGSVSTTGSAIGHTVRRGSAAGLCSITGSARAHTAIPHHAVVSVVDRSRRKTPADQSRSKTPTDHSRHKSVREV